ncbi:hypothetical protein [Thioalbus denitrificans]|uniref:TadE-like protein n=1 Tax=Thioalbus denitrificans TaxID=547122 RepID=A0A369BK85_9GAMM|nr:hypothetical protein [Thioalbus denitrificans]RCX21973.1 hypothetical protein DFQ59_12014 [Thioalbus denitrificans]
MSSRLTLIPSARGRCSGTALAEFTVVLTVMVPLFLAVPVLGKLLDIKHQTVSANRYALWERTVWSDPGAGWNDEENSKSDHRLGAELEARFFGHPASGVQAEKTDNPLWHDHAGQALIATAGGAGARLSLVEQGTPVRTLGMDEFAHAGLGGVPVLGQLTGGAARALNGLGGLVPECGAGVDVARGLNLGRQGFARATVVTPAVAPVVVAGRLEFAAGGALLTNGWSAPRNERGFQHRVDRLVTDELVGCVTAPGRYTFGNIALGRNRFLFGEGQNSHPVEAAVDSTGLIEEYIR